MGKRIILLNGPSSSGKSTLAAALRASLQARGMGAWEIVSIDDFMKVPAGETIYEDDVFEIAGDLCEAVRAALKTAPGVIVDHVITSERIFRRYKEALRPFEHFLVRVSCPTEVLRQREKARGDRCPGSAEASEKYLYPRDGYDLCVDTSVLSAEACADRICERLPGDSPDGKKEE